MSKIVQSKPNLPILSVPCLDCILNIFTLIDKRMEEFCQALFLHMITKEASNAVENSSREDASRKACMQYMFLIVFHLMVHESLF